jgi:hypothetical protein
VLALEGSGGAVDLGGTNTETELVERDERHPLLVEDILTGGKVGGDVSTDGVAEVLGSVGVELTTRVTVDNVDAGTVPEAVDLDVGGGLDKVGSGDGAVGDNTVVGVSTRLSVELDLGATRQAPWPWRGRKGPEA